MKKLLFLALLCLCALSVPAMQIYLEMQSVKNIVLNVESSDLIENVKNKIMDREEIQPYLQRLLFNGKELEDGRTLGSYDISNGSTISFSPGICNLDVSLGNITINKDECYVGDTKYYHSGNIRIFSSSSNSVTNSITVDYQNDTVNIALDRVNISRSGSAFDIMAGSGVNLTLIGTNKLNQIDDMNASTLHVPYTATLIVSGDTLLAENQKGDAAVIGGGFMECVGNITINEGFVSAKFNDDSAMGAAIGNGYLSIDEQYDGYDIIRVDKPNGEITINGGTTEAVCSGEWCRGSAIGSAFYGSSIKIVINGGQILADAYSNYYNSSAIGGGFIAFCGPIEITGGTIKTVHSSTSYGIGSVGELVQNILPCQSITITGGSVNGSCSVTPTNGSANGNQELTLYKLDYLPSLPGYYGTTDMVADENGDYYFYLRNEPTGVKDITSNEVFVYRHDKTIFIDNADNKAVAVYTTLGQCVFAGKGVLQISVHQAGVYIVNVDGEIHKIAVK